MEDKTSGKDKMKFSKEIKIGEKMIGENYPTFIIAEAGVNHNGDINLAKKLVDKAVYAGVDAVKFQTFTSEKLVTTSAEMATYQKENLGKTEPQIAMLKKLELSHEDFVELKNYCDEKGILFLSTAHTEDAIDFLYPLVPLYKVGSGDLNNIPALKKMASKNKPMILGTGMSYLDEVVDSAKAILDSGNTEMIFLHCTTNYPCPRNEVNLRAMKTLKKELDCIVGYSDHTLGVDVSLMAVKLGANVIEKHFTLNKNLPGPDHKASLDPEELKELVDKIREFEEDNLDVEFDEEVMGSPIKAPNDSEKKILEIARKSVVSKVKINAGDIISEDMLTIKRPGTGLAPKKMYDLIGKKAVSDIEEDRLIKLSDIK